MSDLRVCFISGLGALALVVGCAPAGVVPNSTSHPANPSAPAATADAASTTLASGGMDHGGTDKLAAAEMAAFMKAKPVFEEHCSSCHTKKAKAAVHFSMDSYPFGGHHASTIASEIRTVLGTTGKKATMPKDEPGAVKGEELALVLAWADAFDKAHPAKKNGGHDHASHGAKPKKPAAKKKGHDHSSHDHGAKPKKKKKKPAKKPHDHSSHQH